MTVISSDKNKGSTRDDTIGVVKGLEPFFYSFNNDTLKLFFFYTINYEVKEKFKSINVTYIALDREEFKAIRIKSREHSQYYSVPIYKKD